MPAGGRAPRSRALTRPFACLPFRDEDGGAQLVSAGHTIRCPGGGRGGPDAHTSRPLALWLAAACSPPPATLLPAASGSTTPAPPDTPAGIAATERWIEVDLRAQKVRLHDGAHVVAEYLAASGVGTSPETST